MGPNESALSGHIMENVRCDFPGTLLVDNAAHADF